MTFSIKLFIALHSNYNTKNILYRVEQRRFTYNFFYNNILRDSPKIFSVQMTASDA